MIKKIKNNIKFLENFSYLSFLQIFNLIIPFITYPYIIRVVGTELYGTVVFAQAVVLYFSLIIEFGFNMSATKNISENINDIKKLSEIVSSVLLLKFILWLVCLSILLICMFIFPEIGNHKMLYIFAFMFTFHDFLFPQFFFQGIEKMKYITFINVFVRSLFLVAVFFVIKDQSDYLKLPLLNGCGALLGGIIALYIVFVKEKIFFTLPSLNTMKSHFKDSFVIFSTKLFYCLKDRTAVILVGILFSKTIVTYYDLAIKLSGLFSTLYHVVPVSILPRLIKSKNITFSKFIFRLTILSGLLYTIFISVFAKYIVSFLGGNDLLPAVPYVRLFVVTTPFLAINILLNYYLVINENKNEMFRSTFYSLLSFILLLFLLFIKSNLYLLILIFVGSLVFETIYKLYIFKKNRSLSKWII